MSAAENKAVFLSYASQDAEAARRICEALRSGGVEVWFDADGGLEHGDEWDQKIRRQIKECVLFIPIISENTQARHEGYFRIEWELAAQRAMGIASGVPFILPVVIDDTREPDALVPDRFRAVQWTRLLSGEVPPEVLQRFLKLWSHRTGVLKHEAQEVAQASSLPSQDAGKMPALPVVGRRVPAAAWAVAVIAISLAAGGYFWLKHPAGSAPIPAQNAGAGTRPPTAAQPDGLRSTPVAAGATVSSPAPDPKSVAVLAFDNLSDEKSNEYFSDGISEELISALAKVPGLKVTARTSAFYFKGKNVPVAEIAGKLNVAYVIEGTVQRAGDSVRISAQLIKAADGYQVWSDRFDRELKNVFALQDEIAGLIAKNLQLKLGAPARIASAVNPEAHRLILEGRHFWRLRTDDGFARAEADFNRAVELDPRWAPAHAALADLWVMRALYRLLDGAPFEENLVRARAAAAHALELDPDLADPHSALGMAGTIEGHVLEARLHFDRALALAPNDATVRDWLGDLDQSTGRLDLALQEYRTAAQLDPLSPFILADLGRTLPLARRFGEALEMLERAEALQPGRVRLGAWRAYTLLELGRRQEAGAALQAVLPKLRSGSEDGGEVGWLVIYVLRRLGRDMDAHDVGAALLQAMKGDRSQGALLRFALGENEQALALIERAPNTMTMAQYLFWHPIFDAIREQARFQQLLVKIGRADQYQVARETLARMLKDQANTK